MASSSMLFPTAAAADENAIAYELFFSADTAPAVSDGVATSTTTSSSSSSHDHNDDEQSRQTVMRACDDMLAFAREFTRGFIWQCQQFHLALAEMNTECARACGVGRYYLQGYTRVGDEIQDEWVVTALLVALTERFPHVVARTRDSDGEFLLIECADALPEWVHPENSAGRVLLRGGELHLVPLAVIAEDRDATAQAARRRRQRQGQATSSSSNGALDLLAGHDALTARRCLRAVLEQPVATRASDAMQRALHSRLSDVPRFMRENRHRVRCLLPVRAAHVLARRPEVLSAAVEAFYYREPTRATAICARMAAFPLAEAPVTRAVAFSRCMFAQLKQQQFFAPRPFSTSALYRDALAALESAPRDPVVLAAEIGMKLACGLELLYAANECDQFGVSWRQVIDDVLASSASGDDATDTDTEPLVANDDDAWLYVHPDSLEEKLQQVEAAMSGASGVPLDDNSGGAEELESIATMFNNFLGGVSDIDGVEGAEPIHFDMTAFMDILNGDGNTSPREPRFSEGGEYFYEDDDDDDDDDTSGNEDADSSDDEDNARMDAAMAEMDAELATTHMGKSFARIGGANATAADAGEDGGAALDDEIAADTPLDLDFNLLSNLLESFASQDGHAGPVSNILGELTFPRAK